MFGATEALQLRVQSLSLPVSSYVIQMVPYLAALLVLAGLGRTARLPGAARHYPKLLPLMNTAFESFDLSAFDLVVSSSHSCAKNVLTPPTTRHVCYCHTPMRHAWEPRFLAQEDIGRAGRIVLPLLLDRLRAQDLAGASRPDVFVANSAYVAARITKYYRRSARVIHPPVDVASYLATPRREEGAQP